jgi:heme exporter protein C
MRDKTIYTLGISGTLILLWNLHTILMVLPDEAMQGTIGKMLLIHAPAAIAGMTLYFGAVLYSILFLRTKNFEYDSVAAALIEVGQMYTLINLVTGSIWGHIIWGIWWTWDARLTRQFMCFMLYLGYLLMRPVISEATQRGTISAFVAIFAAADIPLVWFAIRVPDARTQHPGPVLETGTLHPTWRLPFLLSWVAFMLIGTALAMVRVRQENARREIDSLRRELHAA